MMAKDLRDICQAMMKTGVFHDENQAYAILHASLKTIRDRLPVNEAAQFGRHLPLSLKDLYFKGWNRNQRTFQSINKSDFLSEVKFHLNDLEEHSLSELVPVALKQILHLLSQNEEEYVKHLFPNSMRDVFDDRISME